MKNQIPIILIAFLLSGCYTVNKASKQVIKAHANFPQVTAEYCAAFYPPKDSVIVKRELVKGEVIKKIDSFYVDCDSIVKNNPLSPGNKKVLAPPCVSTHSVDTVYDTKEIVRENTAKIAHFEFQLKEKEAANVRQSVDIAFYKKFMWAFFGLLAINAFMLARKFKILPF